MRRWEYQEVAVEDGFINAQTLAGWGQQGWELVSVVSMVVPLSSSTDSFSQTAVTEYSNQRNYQQKWYRQAVDSGEMTAEEHAETAFQSKIYCIAYLKRPLD